MLEKTFDPSQENMLKIILSDYCLITVCLSVEFCMVGCFQTVTVLL